MTDHFPQLLKDAATKWGNETTGFAQFREQVDGNTIRIKLRLQATDIMTEFVGEVHFGRDPKGILFYHRQSDFKVEDADYQVFYHRGPGHSVAVRVDFYVTGENEAFARFLARVDTSKYPLPRESGVKGTGRWKPFIAATSQTHIHKVSTSPRVRLRFPPIRKQVIFNTDGDVNKPHDVDTNGILIFPDLASLQNVVGTQVVADYAPDRIVFFPRGNHDKVIALFLPAEPVKIDIKTFQPPATTWTDFNPSASSFAEARSIGKFATDLDELAV